MGVVGGRLASVSLGQEGGQRRKGRWSGGREGAGEGWELGEDIQQQHLLFLFLGSIFLTAVREESHITRASRRRSVRRRHVAGATRRSLGDVVAVEPIADLLETRLLQSHLVPLALQLNLLLK